MGFAKKHNLRVTIKSTGLESWGRSSAHGSFSINLMEMKQISVNAEKTERSEHGELTVQTGATFEEIYTEVNLERTSCQCRTYSGDTLRGRLLQKLLLV